MHRLLNANLFHKACLIIKIGTKTGQLFGKYKQKQK